LLRKAHKRSTVDVLTARGVLYSRGESYDENRYFSNPGDWPRLAESHRREFIQRTDRGVFSLQAEAILNQSPGYRALAGRGFAIDAASATWSSRSSTAQRPGFPNLSCLGLMSDRVLRRYVPVVPPRGAAVAAERSERG
jgi:hypothetical protein